MAEYNDAPVSVESILFTEELDSRPSRPPDFERESRALSALMKALGDSPETVLQTLADKILEVCNCGSAGISLLTAHDGGERFYWPAIAGMWSPHIGGGTPRDFGPCGDVLDRNSPQLFKHVELRYTYFQPVQPLVEEALLVPFYVEGKAVGTIWAVAHDPARRFDAEDRRQLLTLGQFASAAYQAVAYSGSSRQLAAIVESSDDAIVSKTLDGVIRSWNKSAERMFGYTAEEAVGKNITLILPPDRLDEEAKILGQLRRGERVDHFETLRRRKDGTLLDISLTISPVRDASGRVIGASKVARDITARKQTETELKAAHDKLEARVQERTAELRRKNEELEEQANLMRGLSRRLLQLQDHERRRIARELHDSVGQLLAAIQMNISTVSHEKANLTARGAECVEENSRLVEQVSQEIRTLSHLLHPPFLDEIGLRSALMEYVEGFVKRSKIEVALQIPAHFERLPQDLETSLFRIVQECLTNIHRHSGSSTAAISIARRNDTIHLEVSDQGKGMLQEKEGVPNSGEAAGVGLRGMRERVAQLGGTLQIHSNGTGTIVTATLPLVQSRSVAAKF